MYFKAPLTQEQRTVGYSSAHSCSLVFAAAAEELRALSAQDVGILTHQICYSICIKNVSNSFEISSTFVVKRELSNELALCT